MKDPVVTADGHSYERAAIEEGFQHQCTSPLTGATLASKVLIPAHALRSAIEEWPGELPHKLDQKRQMVGKAFLKFEEALTLMDRWQHTVPERGKAKSLLAELHMYRRRLNLIKQ